MQSSDSCYLEQCACWFSANTLVTKQIFIGFATIDLFCRGPAIHGEHS